MPGSPPKRIKEPGTIPPPSTRLSSPSVVSIRISWLESISFIRKGFGALVLETDSLFQADFSSFWMISSAMVFHSLQELHCPCHFEYCAPQFWQKKEVFTLDIIFLCCAFHNLGNALNKLAIYYFIRFYEITSIQKSGEMNKRDCNTGKGNYVKELSFSFGKIIQGLKVLASSKSNVA